MAEVGFTPRAWAAPADARYVASAIAAQQMGEAEVKVASQAKSELPLGDKLEVNVGSNGLFSFSDVATQVSLFAEGRYRIYSLLQLGMSLTYRYQSADGVSSTAFQGLVGPVLNFKLGTVGRADNGGDGIENAFFASPKLGLTSARVKFGEVSSRSSSELTFSLTLGKRFALSRSIAFAPSIGVVKELNFSPNFTIQPLSLSVFF